MSPLHELWNINVQEFLWFWHHPVYDLGFVGILLVLYVVAGFWVSFGGNRHGR